MQAQNQTQFQLVCAMNVAFGNPAGTHADFLPMPDISSETESHFHAVPWQRLTKQCLNIKDEINELEQAVIAVNDFGIRDAICDIRVFTYGAAHFMGFDMDSVPTGASADFDKLCTETEIRRDPIFCLSASYDELMLCLASRDITKVQDALWSVFRVIVMAARAMGYTEGQILDDMKVVVGAVMTRFIKSPEDKIETRYKHAAKGVIDVYFEGEYPTMIMKSASDQPDAPKGKFLKSASYSEPVFTAQVQTMTSAPSRGPLR